jgi:exopolysaccharide biosynthesis polyprenyl glycosylphosphotransferase
LQNFPTARKILLLAGDIVLTSISVWLGLSTVLWTYPVSFATAVYFNLLPVNVFLIGLLFGAYGLFTLARKRYSEIFIGIFLSVATSLVLMMAISFYFREFSYSRGVLVVTAAYELVLFNIWQYAVWRMERLIAAPKSALIVGGEKACRHVLARLSISPQLSYEVKAVANDLGKSDDWKKNVPDVDLVILCSDLSMAKKEAIVSCCQEEQTQVLLMPSIYELYCRGLTIDKIDDIPFFRPQYMNPTLEQRSLKRLFDIGFSLLALIITAVPMAFIAILIKLDSRGPILYRQVRTGRYGQEFAVCKFRSMREDAEAKSGPVMAGADDPRITHLGKWLRRTRLDELPQFFNVLGGSMSVVGPRPERPFFVAQFQAEIPEYTYRHNVKPGITGMAQVYGKYNTIPYDKLIYDLMYVQQCGIFTDLVIIIQTVRVLFQKSSTEGVKA